MPGVGLPWPSCPKVRSARNGVRVEVYMVYWCLLPPGIEPRLKCWLGSRRQACHCQAFHPFTDNVAHHSASPAHSISVTKEADEALPAYPTLTMRDPFPSIYSINTNKYLPRRRADKIETSLNSREQFPPAYSWSFHSRGFI